MSAWFFERRMEWIAETLRVYGFVNREHIQRKFGVSTPQASADVQAFMQRHPLAVRYNASSKRYEATDPRCAPVGGEPAQAAPEGGASRAECLECGGPLRERPDGRGNVFLECTSPGCAGAGAGATRGVRGAERCALCGVPLFNGVCRNSECC